MQETTIRRLYRQLWKDVETLKKGSACGKFMALSTGQAAVAAQCSAARKRKGEREKAEKNKQS